MPPFKHTLCWFRRDLRITDHHALAEASKQGTSCSGIFIFDPQIISTLPKNDLRMTFIFESLIELKNSLKEYGIPLYIVEGNPEDILPHLLKNSPWDALFFNHDDDPYALARDAHIEGLCKTAGIPSFHFKDHVIFERREILNQTNLPYRVFTPYKNEWLRKLTALPQTIVSFQTIQKKSPPQNQTYTPKIISELSIPIKWIDSLKDLNFESQVLPIPAGEHAAQKQLKMYLPKIASYDADRNDLSKSKNSGLSTALRFGTLSIRACVRAALGLSDNIGSDKATKTKQAPFKIPLAAKQNIWLSELIWRDFFHMLLSQFPHVGYGQSFYPKFDALSWENDSELFSHWCNGTTGFPIVDAAMRCLNQTGTMHNRLRMIVASFLTKDLLIDWRKGEKYFAEKLLDYDLASNNGGWQWCASVGCDAQPYFRIFNPDEQSKKFDPNGIFTLKYCPELAGTKTPFRASVHAVVDHSIQKIRAIQMFEQIDESPKLNLENKDPFSQHPLFVRRAIPSDAQNIHQAHMRSIRNLCANDYSEVQIEAWGGRPLNPEKRIQTILTEDVWVLANLNDIYGFICFQDLPALKSSEACSGEINPIEIKLGEISAFYLAPEGKGKGWGRRLLTTIEKIAKSRGVQKIILNSTLTAKDFYQHLGFIQCAPQTTYKVRNVPIECIPMEKNLLLLASVSLSTPS